MACAANSLIDLVMGDLETFVKSLNAWSGISDAVKWRWWIPESLLMSDFICEVTEVTLNDTVDLDAWLMNIKLSHSQLNCHFHCTVVSISIPIQWGAGLVQPVTTLADVSGCSVWICGTCDAKASSYLGSGRIVIRLALYIEVYWVLGIAIAQVGDSYQRTLDLPIYSH